jgi:hypothetical protein
MADHEKVLTDLGFTEDSEHKAAIEQIAEDNNLSANGPYQVHGAWSKGDIKIHLEQNTAPDKDGELSAQVTHPPLLVVEKAGNRLFALSPRDAEALREVVPTL